MKFLSHFFAFTLLLFSVIACYSPRYVYSPSAHNVPLMEKKGDGKLAANYSTNLADNATGYDMQGAYAFTKHWAGQINSFYRKEQNSGDFGNGFRDSTVINYKRRLTEFAVGYYGQLSKSEFVFFQIFAGAGVGKSGFTDNGREFNGVVRNRFHNADVTKLFIQPAITIRSKASIAGSLSSRFSLINFKNVQTDYSIIELENYTLGNLSNSPHFFWEPSIVFAFGYKKLPGVYLEFQNGFSFLMSRRFVDYRSFNFSMGLMFDLPKLLAINRHSSKN